MLHPLFTDEHEAFRASVRTFVEAELAPHAPEWEREGQFPDWVFKRMGDLGFLGVRYPPEYGGQGGDWGHAIVLADTYRPGFEVSRKRDKLGMRSCDTAELVLDDVRVPSDARLGEEGRGFVEIMWELQGERLIGAAGSVAGAWLVFGKTLEYAK